MNKILFVLFLSHVSFIGSAQKLKSDSLLKVLKSELTRENIYDEKKEKRITQLQHQLLHTNSNDFNARFGLYSLIFEEYHSFKFDSAYIYVKRMIDLSEEFHKKQELIRSKLLLGTILLNVGFYKEAFEVVGQIDTVGLSKALKGDYFYLRYALNGGIAEYDNDAHFAENYRRQSDADGRIAEAVNPSNSFEKTMNQAFWPDSVKKEKNLPPEFFYNTILKQQIPEHNVAMVATRISWAFKGDDKILFLALGAIYDIRSSTKETLAIFLLAQELFHQDDINDAYLFMQEAAQNAKFYGSRNRALQIETMLPLVAGKMVDEKQHEKDKLLIGFLTFLIVAVILFFLLVIYRRQIQRIEANELVIKEKNSQLESVNEKLWESAKIKEELIGLFFKTCSSYIETLDKIKHQTLHNIKLGKYKDVNQLLGNVHIEEEKGHLYNMLDSVFLTMFPNFISSFNALLKKEDQIWPKSGETLNATLRIFALIRLGINEHEAIAKILDYSVSTVYTYKMRIKSRALVPANDFEQKIMEIKFIESNNHQEVS